MARKRALVVDDSESARVILSRMLEKYEIEVDLAESAEQAIHYLKTNRPDAIFMDHLMPGMDGIETIRQLRAINPAVKIIALSGDVRLDGPSILNAAHLLGATEILEKPFRNDALVKLVDDVLTRSACRLS